MSNAAEPPGGAPRTVVIGLGNATRGDDGAGPAALRAIRPWLPEGVEAREAPGDVAALLEAWDGADRVFVVDATRSATPPGTVVRWEAGRGAPLPAFAPTSTHGLSLGEAVGLAEALGRTPRSLVLYGIESGGLTLGASLTPAVERAAHEVADRILAELGAASGRRASGGAAHA